MKVLWLVNTIMPELAVLLNSVPSVFGGWLTGAMKAARDIGTDMVICTVEKSMERAGRYEANGVARALTMERFVRKLYTHARMICNSWSPDVVIASSTYPLDTFPSQKIAKKAGAKYIHEFHDLWPASASHYPKEKHDNQYRM